MGIYGVKKKYWVLALLCCCISFGAVAQQGFLYVTVADYGASFRIQAAFEAPRLIDTNSVEGLSITYQLGDDDNQFIQTDTFLLASQKLEKINDTFYFQFSLKADKAAGKNMLLTLADSVTNKELSQLFTIPRRGSELGFEFYNLSQDLRFNYNRITDPLLLRSKDSLELTLYRFKQEFKPAAPPMVTNFSGGQQQMDVEEILSKPPNKPFTLTEPGLHFIQADTTTSKGVGVALVDEYYPKFSKMDQLAAAIIYISTPEEVEAIQKAQEKKPVFDNFWLNAGGTVENASKLIKIYFRRVAFANRNFTAHKEGWKTDRGIVYIVYGRPNVIEVKEEMERWVYTDLFRNQRLIFTFVKKPNIFTPNNYELVRAPAFKDSWNEMVRRWRSGGIVR